MSSGAFAFESYGATISLSWSESPRFLEVLPDLLPPQWNEITAPPEPDARFEIRGLPSDSNAPRFQWDFAGVPSLSTHNPDGGLDDLERQIRLSVGYHARAGLFVHAGAVSWNGKALMLPGSSYSGKSTLVTELVELGASYLTDEYAVLTDDGSIVAYPRAIRLRPADDRYGQPKRYVPRNTAVRAEPARVELIACIKYDGNERRDLQPLSVGQCVLEIFQNTVAAQKDPQRALRIATTCATQAKVRIRGLRADATQFAPELLAMLA